MTTVFPCLSTFFSIHKQVISSSFFRDPTQIFMIFLSFGRVALRFLFSISEADSHVPALTSQPLPGPASCSHSPEVYMFSFKNLSSDDSADESKEKV